MAGLTANSLQPTAITVHQESHVLEVGFDDGTLFRIPFELMRVYSPSAEVQGHGPGQEVLQTGKRHVGIDALEAVGNYAVQPTFSRRSFERHLLVGVPAPSGLAAGRALEALRRASRRRGHGS